MTSDSDLELFFSENADVVPLKFEPTVRQSGSRQLTPGVKARQIAAQKELEVDRNFLSGEEYIQLVEPRDYLIFKREGIQYGVFKNLRLGKYQIDARLDLHHHTIEQARRAVFEFIDDASRLDIRCVLITHGKGEYRNKPALLKSCVNHWLKELEKVMAFHSAQPMHGGVGAVYVLLRKSDKKRLENLERFQTKRKGV